MAGSVLKRLKEDLQKNDLLRNQSGKKRKAGNNKDRRERDQKVLASIRDAFNPFDAKKNREKYEVLGRNISGQQGKPGISKQVGEKQRKQTYEAQKRLKNRVGGLIDRRFGEQDSEMSAEDKMVARYARERMSRQGKGAAFNLEDDNEVLTHYGQALSFADDFAEGDLGVEDEGLEPSKRRRLEDGVEIPEELAEPEAPHKKSKHEVMQEIIQKSKMHKAARQQAQAQQEDFVDELNAPGEFEALMADLQQYDRSNKTDKPTATEVDEAYDLAVREMAFDRRAVPGDRTKTEEELKKEAAEKRAELEKARQQRMEGQGDDLDAEYNDVANDAELFGFHASDSEGGAASDESDVELPEDGEEGAAAPSKAECPQTLKELKTVLARGGDPIAIIKKILRANDPSKGAGNLQKVEALTIVLCQYALQTKDADLFRDLAALVRTLAPKYERALGKYFREAIRKAHDKIAANKPFSGADLLLFTLIGVLFSTSDQWHLVANGAVLTMTQHLSKTMDMSAVSVAVDLYLCDLLLSYQRISKRYIPEIPALLLKALSAVDGVTPAAKYVRVTKSQPLTLSSKFADAELGQIALTRIGSTTSDQAVLQLVGVIDRASQLWKGISAYSEIFAPLQARLAQLPTNKKVQEVADKLARTVKFAAADKVPLRLQEMRPVGIITHAPAFEDNYNPDVKSYEEDPDRREQRKLKALLKKERKQTIKEIRRDAEFESREKLEESRNSARDYHQMLSRLTNQINSEEGAEKNRYERERRRRKR